MNILVTGGSGFLGSHVADALSDAGHDVTIFDAIPSPWLGKGQTMVTGDLLDADALTRAVQGKDAVYHFAGIADIEDCAKSPVATASINILGTVKLLETCVNAGVKRFVFASSAYVFSESGSFYRTSKRACESFIEDFSKRYGLKYTCLRYGSLYGPRADGRNSIHSLLRQAVETGTITYHGNGDELREFIHVFDAAKSSVDILAPEFENQHVILTGVEKMTYRDLLEMIREIFGGRIELNMLPRDREAHYRITPYSFAPKLGRKLVGNSFVDFGQGLLHCIEALHAEKMKREEDGGRN
ncbi:NAD-dependent epimerase/dehydratase family protein [Pseudodesulfovibrio tunisiensis]|uniref:NAD-dependent epimerase/dehydratase family protein n=1 Tax=Pseudodesulfovibrio tunisiensis TaxID=463192 RepID=UPI001FB3BD94|nr:NAD(P)-dependent oxidoreductase [Pseudodesulfovibrio tunisiensis]